MKIIVLLACSTLACRSSEAPAPQHKVESPPIAIDASPDGMPRLAAEREEFWGKFVGEGPAQLGPEMQAWCTASDKEERRDVVPKVVELARDRDVCSLLVWQEPSEALRSELRAVLARWSGRNWAMDRAAGSWIDTRGRWTAEISDAGGPLAVHWHPHVELEELLGKSGKLLAGMDVESLVGAPVMALRKIVRPPFRLERCDATSCAATGPSAPGGQRLRVFAMDVGSKRGVGVDVIAEDTRQAHVLISQSIGPADPVATAAARAPGRATYDVHRREGIRYLVSVDSGAVRVLLEPDPASDPP
jgi:hypothetical protein